MIITIARQCGCDGDNIGKLIAAKYGIPFYNKESISKIAKEKGIYDEHPDFYGEEGVSTLLCSISEETDEERLRKIPVAALAEVIDDENFVIFGHCGNYAYRDKEDVFSIFIVGDLEDREARIAETHGIPLKKAAKIVEETDDKRRQYHKFYTGEVWGLASAYDLCINTSSYGSEEILKIVDFGIQNKLKKDAD